MNPGKSLPQMMGKNIFPKFRLAVPAQWQVVRLRGPQQPASRLVYTLQQVFWRLGGVGILLGFFFLEWELDYLGLQSQGETPGADPSPS
jgi:hypothetical protein